MTCKERLILDHPNWSMKDVEDIISIECPEIFGYLPDPDYCEGFSSDCVKCWNREIVEQTENSKCDDTSELDELRNKIDIYEKRLEAQKIELERCKAMMGVIEQFTNTRMPKIRTDF